MKRGKETVQREINGDKNETNDLRKKEEKEREGETEGEKDEKV